MLQATVIRAHSNYIPNILTTFQPHSKHSDRILETVEMENHFKPCQNVPMS